MSAAPTKKPASKLSKVLKVLLLAVLVAVALFLASLDDDFDRFLGHNATCSLLGSGEVVALLVASVLVIRAQRM